MKYLVATSDSKYFHWQMLVQINNFKNLGILDNLTYVVAKTGKRKSKYLGYIEKETGVNVVMYDDDRNNPSYASSIRPHIIKKFLMDNPDYVDCFFYLDPDVIFLNEPIYPTTVIDSNYWFLSDTRSYLDSRYIKSKGEELFLEMCRIVGINPNTVENNDREAGGAQYIIKGTDYNFWDKVEKDSEELYKYMNETKHKYNPKHPIQAWTADMWALLWNAWLNGYQTKIWSKLGFSWATSNINQLSKFYIHHNAGVFNQDYLFNKGKYANHHPFDDDLSFVSKDHCNYRYIQEINWTSLRYSELVKKL